MKKNVNKLFLLMIGLGLLAACDTDADTNGSGDTSSSTSDSFVYSTETSMSDMTDTEVAFIDSKIAVLQDNVDHFQTNGEVQNAEVIYATLQEVYEYNLTPEQETQITEVVSQLPPEFIDYQMGLLMSKNNE